MFLTLVSVHSIMPTDILRRILNTAEDTDNEDLEVVANNLYMTNESRPTEHVLKFSEKADEEFQDYVMGSLNETNHEIIKENEMKFRIIVSD